MLYTPIHVGIYSIDVQGLLDKEYQTGITIRTLLCIDINFSGREASD